MASEIPNIDRSIAPPEQQFVLSPETGKRLSDWLGKSGFQLWGHGTPNHDKESFYTTGVSMLGPNGTYGSGGYDSITSIALPLSSEGSEGDKDITDLKYMTDWPHKRNQAESPRVVLLAVPEADETLNATLIDRHLVDVDEDRSFPSELVVGFLDPDTLVVDINRAFSPTPAVREKYLSLVKERIAAVNEKPHAALKAVGEIALINAYADRPDSNDVPMVR